MLNIGYIMRLFPSTLMHEYFSPIDMLFFDLFIVLFNCH